MKRQVIMAAVLITVMIISAVFPLLTAMASVPPTPGEMSVGIENPPENAVFADILIRINERDPNFTDVNEDNLVLFGLDNQAGIVGFNDGGFRSFTFHYNGASSEIHLSESSWRYYFVHFGIEVEGQFQNLLENYSDMKIALLDYAGDVISVSASFSLPRPRRGVFVSIWVGPEVSYNHETGDVAVHLFPVRYNYLRSILRPALHRSPFLVLSAVTLLSVVLELAAGLCFGFRKKILLRTVLASLVTQAFIVAFTAISVREDFVDARLLIFLIVPALVVGASVAEHFFYRRSSAMKNIGPQKILRYTIAANSLGFAFLVLFFINSA
ncbi:MAG: hypothetical protein FWB75_02195 [Oscillospiraceae bacterium]|nr:hypothetical protein [Oscillospiraceae bacterium]